MSKITAEASALIPARAEDVYGVLADYQVGHPAILPEPYFTELRVEEGGYGAGTVIRVGMEVLGAKRSYLMVVSEPDPGRVLRETDSEAGVVTTFTVEPTGAEQARVTIATSSRAAPGVQGWIEKLINPPISRHIYNKELAKLAEYVGTQQKAQ